MGFLLRPLAQCSRNAIRVALSFISLWWYISARRETLLGFQLEDQVDATNCIDTQVLWLLCYLYSLDCHHDWNHEKNHFARTRGQNKRDFVNFCERSIFCRIARLW